MTSETFKTSRLLRAALFSVGVVSLGCGAPSAAPHDAAPPPVDGAPPPVDTNAAPPQDAPAAPADVVTPGIGTPFGANIGPVTTCDTSKPFGPATMIEGTVMEDDSFTFSPDYLTIYWASVRSAGSGGFGIYTATRPSLGERFGQLQPIAYATGGGGARFPVLSRDGLTLFYTWADREIRGAKRSSVTSDFDQLGGIEGLPLATRVWFSSDEKQVYFDNGADLGVADFDSGTATATNRRELTALNSTSADSGPVLTADGLSLYFSSNRPVAGSDSGFRLYVARRAKVSDPFGAPQLITELVPAIHDNIFGISPEGCTIYFRRVAEHADHYPMLAVRGK